MSSRFVSGGAIDAATGDAVDLAQVKKQQAASSTTLPLTAAPTPATQTPAAAPTARQAEWAAVEKELEAERQRRAAARTARASGAGQDEKSLYEVLQANKAAKQAAFEEEHRLKHQFRALDEDEVAFLDGIEADARAAAARVAAETAAGLDAFRAAQTKKSGRGDGTAEDAEEKEGDDNDTIDKLVDDGGWAVSGRKRKRRADKTDRAGAFPNLRRKGSSTEKETAATKAAAGSSASGTTQDAPKPAAAARAPPSAAASKPKPALGLVSYGSDDDDDDDDDDDSD
ncbi:hypothetical protein HMPREF1624_08408 [Sporothrix schenckii ATCC 58251]|uniref:FAM192A/Fyv6 N-terminal domain-containing protein n=1 Tax=Sporothrix schenckii (strain ATCC 58251 / de Perez 2211183) TaxID=1391915 RepID=U7PI33_SPOS1|nr:hypothetical protein HMPREF1624_08408 [Sporothrix schenckii ATCC 58251]